MRLLSIRMSSFRFMPSTMLSSAAVLFLLLRLSSALFDPVEQQRAEEFFRSGNYTEEEVGEDIFDFHSRVLREAADAAVEEQCISSLDDLPAHDEAVIPDSLLSWHGKRLETFSDVASSVKRFTSDDVAEEVRSPETTFHGLEAGIYLAKGWFKLESEPGSSRSLSLGMRLKGQPRNESSTLTKVATTPECWTRLETSFNVEEGANDITVHIGGYEGLDSLLLARFFVSRVSTSYWRKQQDRKISQIRMRSVGLKIRTKTGGLAKGATVKISQISHYFTFGASVSGAITASKELRTWFKSRFNMATFQNELKWQFTEPNQGNSNYKIADSMVSVLRALNIPIRGHSVFWDPYVNMQPWVLRLGAQDLKRAVARRMKSLISRYAGKFVHWDVMNEALHGTYLDDILNDKNFAAATFRNTRQLDSKAKLFINEYNVVEYYKDSGSTPAKVIEQVTNINAGGGSVQGIGAQGHFGSVNPPLVKDALDKLAKAGIPVWLTEFDINQRNTTVQADGFEAVMREAFSNPVVGGVIFWEAIRMPCSVWSVSVYGRNCDHPCYKCLSNPDFTDRPMGERYAALLDEWTTKFTSKVDSSSNVMFRGFYGDYKAEVTYNGESYVRYFKVPAGQTRAKATVVL